MIEKNKFKNILILTAQFGAGHISAANAIKDAILEKYSTFNITIQNFMIANDPKVNDSMVKFYERNTKYTPVLYNYYYYLKKSFDSKYDITHKIYTPKLTNYILDKNPDLIISTFPLAAACVDSFKVKHPDINISTLTVITDVVDSLEWVYPHTDMYFVPALEIKNRFVQKGISPDSIKVTGVPINKKFNVSKKISIPNKNRLLILGGGRGLFDISEDFIYWIDKFLDDFKSSIEVTIVTGSNTKLYNNLAIEKPLSNISVLGYVNNMHELVKNYDLMITKPGGATLFEAIHSQTPVIIRVPKIGQEIENSRFIIDKGIGILYNDENDLKKFFYNLSSGRFEPLKNFMQSNISNLKNTIHSDKIPDYIFELLNK